MTRETRINLIFLIALLALTLPGGVILFRKKMDPTRPPSFMPDGRRDRIAYNDPREAPDLNRYVPPLTGQWVAHLAEEHGLPDVVSPNNQPVVSASRHLQFINTAKANEVHFLYWGELAATDQLRFGNQPATSLDSDPIDIPDGVRQELIYAGYAQPPKRATWIIARPPEVAGTTASLIHGDGTTDSVPLFTK